VYAALSAVPYSPISLLFGYFHTAVCASLLLCNWMAEGLFLGGAPWQTALHLLCFLYHADGKSPSKSKATSQGAQELKVLAEKGAAT
jgi:hypothetical protein